MVFSLWSNFVEKFPNATPATGYPQRGKIHIAMEEEP